MADLVPVVTNTNPATWDAAGIINLLNSHTWSASWEVDDHNVGQGTTIRHTTETFQCNFRKNASGSAADVALSIEPAGTITDAGNDTPTSPTGTGADWSGEWIWDTTLGTPAAGSQFWICEYPDALLLLITNTANTFMVNVCHIGRIYQPFNTNASTLGQDGLGGLSGAPGAPDASTTVDKYWNAGQAADAGLLHYETNNWNPRTYVSQFSPTFAHAGDGTDGETNIFSPPHPVVTDIGGQNVYIGNTKYIRLVGTTAAAKTIKSVSASNQGYLHYRDSVTVDEFTFLWDKTKTL